MSVENEEVVGPWRPIDADSGIDIPSGLLEMNQQGRVRYVRNQTLLQPIFSISWNRWVVSLDGADGDTYHLDTKWIQDKLWSIPGKRIELSDEEVGTIRGHLHDAIKLGESAAQSDV